jgi:RNA polymerase sigma factor (sigma-70 family)
MRDFAEKVIAALRVYLAVAAIASVDERQELRLSGEMNSEDVREPLPGPSDYQLLTQYARSGSNEAFSVLSRRYARLVFSTCLRETGNPSLAEDASQGVFLLLSQKAGGIGRKTVLAGWLYNASRNISRNLVRQETRRARNEAAQLDAELTPERTDNPLWDQIEEHLHGALSLLKPHDRDAILLRYVQDLPLADVGMRLGQSENAVRMRIARALEKVRGHLKKAGVLVTLVALTGYLEAQRRAELPAGIANKISQIGEPDTGPISNRVLRAVSEAGSALTRASLQASASFGLAVLFLIIGITLGSRYVTVQVPRMLQQRMFKQAQGNWSGRLTYADDQTRKQYSFATNVDIDSAPSGDSLVFTARYSGTDRVDITTLVFDKKAQRFTIENGGPHKSHSLHAIGKLVKLGDGDIAFVGVAEDTANEVRVRMIASGRQLVISEEYRTPLQQTFQFRNRYVLLRN